MRTDGYRWVVLAPFPAAKTEALGERLAAASGKAVRFLLLEELDSPLVLESLDADADELVVVDALHVPETDRVTLALKLLLKNFPKRSFVVLGGADARRIAVPDYLGSGVVLAADADGVPTEPAGADDLALLAHARKIVPRYRLPDLVLGSRSKLRFDEVLAYLRTRERVDASWGFRSTHSRGHGVTVLLHGASGTGKTMAAEVIASETGLPLYQIDLSSVTSKYVGETEKNLKTIFRAAEGVRGILLFDEGDAIFGQRTEVKQGNDRYANLEVNYLLQELDAFQGIAVLSTNHEKNMDEAFTRRFTFSMTFGLPTPSMRAKIWRANAPRTMPLASDVDFDRLAAFSLSGGNIRNCLRHAAARAMAQARPAVSQVDLLWAVKRELQKYGTEIPRELVGEDYWRQVGPEWELASASRGPA